jgi:hypothetical protein
MDHQVKPGDDEEKWTGFTQNSDADASRERARMAALFHPSNSGYGPAKETRNARRR